MTKFDEVVKAYGPRLMRDLAVGAEDAAAVFGNGGHESGGFRSLQEIKPTVKGSKGGYGWFQWTGPRRRNYEAFCKRNGLNPAADESNYAFLLVELRGPYKSTMPKVKQKSSLYDKVVAFEMAYEKAGVKHYDSRNNFAKQAYGVLSQMDRPAAFVAPLAQPKGVDKPMILSKTSWMASAGAALSSVTAFFSGLHPIVQGMVVVAAVGAAIFIIYDRRKKAQAVREATAVAAANV